MELPGKLSSRKMAWHPTLKKSVIYAVAEDRECTAVHLIDAQRHRRLITWSSQDLASMLQVSAYKGNPHIAWHPDGTKLAIANSTGTVILSFTSGQVE